jgi:mycothiol synthase
LIDSSDFIIRAPTPDDAAAIVELINICWRDAGGADDFTPSMLHSAWDNPNFTLAANAWVIAAPDRQLLGYEELARDAAGQAHELDGCVHPAYANRGFGTRLLRLAEQRARTMSVDGAHLRGTIEADSTAAQQLFEAEGYSSVRHFSRMEIDFDAPPPAPVWPDGMVVRAYLSGQDERVAYETYEKAFEDHWGHTRRSFEDWVHELTGRPDFDPSLWFLATERDEVVGTVLCYPRTQTMAWVRGLGVRRAWRGRGLGIALLRQAFGAFYARGYRSAGLGVDAQSLTGATRLYERAGMCVTERYMTMEKALE